MSRIKVTMKTFRFLAKISFPNC